MISSQICTQMCNTWIVFFTPLNAVFFSCRVHSCLPYLDLSGCSERTNAIHFVQEIAGEYSLLFLGMDADDPDHWGLSLQKISLDNLTMSDSLSIWKWMGSLHVMEENMDYEQLAGKYRLLPGTISEIFTCAERRRRECGQNTIGLPLLIPAYGNAIPLQAIL